MLYYLRVRMTLAVIVEMTVMIKVNRLREEKKRYLLSFTLTDSIDAFKSNLFIHMSPYHTTGFGINPIQCSSSCKTFK